MKKRSGHGRAAGHESRQRGTHRARSRARHDILAVTESRRALIHGLALAAIAILAYLPALAAGFIWDDDDYVTGNMALRSLEGLWRIWSRPGTTPQYYPMVHTTFWIEYHLWGLNAAGYHFVNVALHATNAVLLWRVLCRLSVPGCWLAAAIFAVHPVHVESVAWITERKNVLSAVFYLAAALALLRCLELAPDRTDAKRSFPWRWCAAGFALYLAALLSKTVTASLPAALLLVAWWKRGRLRRSDIAIAVPMLLVGAGFGLYTAWMERENVGAVGAAWDLGWTQRTLIAGRALWFYAAKLLVPVKLAFIYPRWQVNSGAALQYVFPVAALAVIVTLWALRSRIGRGPVASVLFFAGTLFPALGFVNTFPMLYSFVADHFQYLASIGLIALFAAGADHVTHTAPVGQRLVGIGILVAILGGLTWVQCGVYRDQEVLWRDTIAKNPSCAMAHNNLGFYYVATGRRGDGLAAYQQALKMDPTYSLAHFNLAMALRESGQLYQAIAHFEAGLKAKPDDADGHRQFADTLDATGRTDEAIEHYRRALQVARRPSAATDLNLANVLARRGGFEEAEKHFRHAIRLESGLIPAYVGLANVLAEQKRPEDAVAVYQQALKRAPGDPTIHFNLGLTYDRMNRGAEAAAAFRKALGLRPGWPEAAARLSQVEAELPAQKP